MKHDLIAPQFGLAGRFDRAPDDPSQPATTSALAYSGSTTFRPTSGPTVVVKAAKRRRLDVAGGEPIPDDASASPKGSMASAAQRGGNDATKAPRVFRVASTHAAPSLAPGSQPELSPDSRSAAVQTMSADPSADPSPSAPRRRRRRDPITAPVLVRHVVFERPPQVDGTVEVRQSDRQIEEPAGDRASYAAVRRALHRLRQDVEALMKAQELLAELEVQVRKRMKARE